MARLCAKTGVGHIVNNAYGVQSKAICAAVDSAWRAQISSTALMQNN